MCRYNVICYYVKIAVAIDPAGRHYANTFTDAL